MHPENESGITLGPGAVYIDGQEMGEVKSVEPMEATPYDRDILACDFSMIAKAMEEISFTTSITAKAWTRLMSALLGIEKEMYDTCPNRRVAHLSRYAKKRRTRNKNHGRMLKIFEKTKRRYI